jgi:hypothetical protein
VRFLINVSLAVVPAVIVLTLIYALLGGFMVGLLTGHRL